MSHHTATSSILSAQNVCMRFRVMHAIYFIRRQNRKERERERKQTWKERERERERERYMKPDKRISCTRYCVYVMCVVMIELQVFPVDEQALKSKGKNCLERARKNTVEIALERNWTVAFHSYWQTTKERKPLLPGKKKWRNILTALNLPILHLEEASREREAHKNFKEEFSSNFHWEGHRESYCDWPNGCLSDCYGEWPIKIRPSVSWTRGKHALNGFVSGSLNLVQMQKKSWPLVKGTYERPFFPFSPYCLYWAAIINFVCSGIPWERWKKCTSCVHLLFSS